MRHDPQIKGADHKLPAQSSDEEAGATSYILLILAAPIIGAFVLWLLCS